LKCLDKIYCMSNMRNKIEIARGIWSVPPHPPLFVCCGTTHLIVEAPWSHTVRHAHSIGLLWQWPVHHWGRYIHNAQQAQQTNIHDLSGIRNRDTSSQASSKLRLRPHDPLNQFGQYYLRNKEKMCGFGILVYETRLQVTQERVVKNGFSRINTNISCCDVISN
jgi:hypothetical protein